MNSPKLSVINYSQLLFSAAYCALFVAKISQEFVTHTFSNFLASRAFIVESMILPFTGQSLHDYLGSPRLLTVSYIIRCVYIAVACYALLLLLTDRSRKIRCTQVGCWFVVGFMLTELFSEWYLHNFGFIFLMEQTVRMCTVFALFPLLLRTPQCRAFVAIAVAATFTGHGILASPLLPTPGHFLDMTIFWTGLNELQSAYFLAVVGILDGLTAIAVCCNRTRSFALFWAVIWGLLTAVARLKPLLAASYLNSTVTLLSISEVLERVCHGFIPLAFLFMLTAGNLWLVRVKVGLISNARQYYCLVGKYVTKVMQ